MVPGLLAFPRASFLLFFNLVGLFCFNNDLAALK